MMKDAATRRAPLRIVGRGHWLDAGAPARSATPLALDALSGIIAYTPGDLTLTARAGTTLSDIAAVTAEHGQWLALDPFGTDDGTIGATIATASAGPLAHAFGTPRDVALGLEVVTGDGSIVRTGGRVVKNVAGFDLTRLFTGSWGTLGVITEVTVRLRARPEVDETWAISLEGNAAIGAACRAALGAAAAPIALELLSAPLAAALGLGTSPTMLVRLAGAAAAMRAQREALRPLGAAAPAPADIWQRLRAAEPAGSTVLRLSHLPDRIGDTWQLAEHPRPGWRHASPGRGIVRVIMNADDDAGAIARAAAGRCTLIAERAPEAFWATGPTPVPNATLASRVRAAFDPAGILNPGLAPDAPCAQAPPPTDG
jgi:glycolate oxidase FAD binding subunit